MANDEKRVEEIVNRIRTQGGAARSADSDFVTELARWRGGIDQPANTGSETLPPLISTDEGELADLITRDVLARSVKATRSTTTDSAPVIVKLEIDLIVSNIEDFTEKGDIPVDAIAVGHYAGVLPQAAERALDLAISDQEAGPGILTRFAQRGLIRGDLGQPFIIPDPRAEDDRLIVLAGMGLPGRFGAPELTILARELIWTMAQLGRKHLATVLIGAGMGNLDQDIAVACWLRGIATALDARTANRDSRSTFPVARLVRWLNPRCQTRQFRESPSFNAIRTMRWK